MDNYPDNPWILSFYWFELRPRIMTEKRDYCISNFERDHYSGLSEGTFNDFLKEHKGRARGISDCYKQFSK